MKNKAVIYVRCVLENSEASKILEENKRDLVVYANAHGYEILKIFLETTGDLSNEKFIEFQKMKDFCIKNEVSIILTSSDRTVSKTFQEWCHVIAWSHKNQIEIYFLKEGRSSYQIAFYEFIDD